MNSAAIVLSVPKNVLQMSSWTPVIVKCMAPTARVGVVQGVFLKRLLQKRTPICAVRVLFVA